MPSAYEFDPLCIQNGGDCFLNGSVWPYGNDFRPHLSISEIGSDSQHIELTIPALEPAEDNGEDILYFFSAIRTLEGPEQYLI